jgi:hypothetical protein
MANMSNSCQGHLRLHLSLRSLHVLCSVLILFSTSLHSCYSFSMKMDSSGVKGRPSGQQAKRERPRIPVLQYHDNWVCVRYVLGILYSMM